MARSKNLSLPLSSEPKANKAITKKSNKQFKKRRALCKTNTDWYQFVADLGRLFFHDKNEKNITTRECYIEALKMIVGFLDSGISNHRRAPLLNYEDEEFSNPFIEMQKFISALEDLNHGSVREFLKSEKIHYRPVDPSDIWLSRIYVCLAVEQFTIAGIPEMLACEVVVDALKDKFIYIKNSRGYEAPSQKKYILAIKKWINHLRNKKLKNQDLQFIYDSQIQNLRSRSEEIVSHYCDDSKTKYHPAFYDAIRRCSIMIAPINDKWCIIDKRTNKKII